MSKKFITNTASLKATIADIRNLDAKKIKLNGKSIPSKVIDERGDFVTDQDLWGTEVTSDENGIIHVSHKFLSNPNASSYSSWNISVNSIKDNKAYTSTDATGDPLCNIQTELIKDGTAMFDSTSFALFSSDLSSLVNGDGMFTNSYLTSFNSNLSNLVNGSYMFTCTSLTTFDCDLNSLVYGDFMFSDTPLASFNSNLDSLVNGRAMFTNTSLTSFRGGLSSLVNGNSMFSGTPLYSFDRDLSSLVEGNGMFSCTSLTSFNSDLSSIVNSRNMFQNTPLTSFSSNLSNLVDGSYMFNNVPLTSFSGDLSSLVNGEGMFEGTSLTSFSSDLGDLVDGSYMFSETHKRGHYFQHYKMVDGVNTEVTKHFRSEGLTSFNGDLGSLQAGYAMFGDGTDVLYKNEEGIRETTKNITPLDEQSVMIIADTIKDLTDFTDWDSSIIDEYRSIIHIGYDSTVCDIENIEKYCTEIMNKGWTVYLNGTVQTTDAGVEGITTTDENGSVTVTPIPYYCKPVEVEQKKANWTNGDKYYIILGAQKVFGDDLSTYGMFTSIEDAAMNMGFTPYEYVEEETEEVEEN